MRTILISQSPSENRIEQLRRLLENEQQHTITFSEAQEIGETLLDFFAVLSEKPEPNNNVLIPETA